MRSSRVAKKAFDAASLRTATVALTCIVLLLPFATKCWAQAPSYSVLYSFQCGPNDGEYPNGNLIADSGGNLYGTTMSGGAFEQGTAYELSADGTETVLHSFAGPPADGTYPQAGLVRDAAGNLYGTTVYGGSFGDGDGTVFEVSASGEETVLYNFGGFLTDGVFPEAGLVRDDAGNLYGTASVGGAFRDGTVFRVSSAGKETVLLSFDGSDGWGPGGGLVRDSAGNLYGTTIEGGESGCPDGCGTVFVLEKTGQEKVLYGFSGPPADGSNPSGNLLRDTEGNLYGATAYGGRGPSCISELGCGTVFKVTPSGEETVLYSFSGGADGGVPPGGLIEDSKGNLYGTAGIGGDLTCGFVGCGVVFELSSTGKEKVLHTFTGPPSDGNGPGALLLSGNAFYGTTGEGGAYNCGTVFKITP
jgi:uncharacterized repeat protein (TIGR03803 family)